MTTGEETSYYYLGNRLVAKHSNTTLNYIHQDHLTGTSLVTSDNGAQLGGTKYYPFGECRNSQGTLGTDKLFTGQRLDDTGLYYYNARYYDANIGRFISADPTIPNFINPQAFNRYSYCLNNPLKFVDPTGLFDQDYLASIGITEETVGLAVFLMLLAGDYDDDIWISVDGVGYRFTFVDPSGDSDGRIGLISEEGGHYYDLTDALIDLKDSNSELWKRVGHGYVEVVSYAMIVPVMPNEGYVDLNVTILCFTFGEMITSDVTYPYFGLAISSSVCGASVTTSTAKPSTGLNVAAQYGTTIYFVGQVGYCFGEGGGRYAEVGAVTFGGSATAFWVWKVDAQSGQFYRGMTGTK